MLNIGGLWHDCSLSHVIGNMINGNDGNGHLCQGYCSCRCFLSRDKSLEVLRTELVFFFFKPPIFIVIWGMVYGIDFTNNNQQLNVIYENIFVGKYMTFINKSI
jgi:hypothetical protein